MEGSNKRKSFVETMAGCPGVHTLGTLRLRGNGDANAKRKRSISPEVLNLHIRDVVTPRRGRENARFGVVAKGRHTPDAIRKSGAIFYFFKTNKTVFKSKI